MGGPLKWGFEGGQGPCGDLKVSEAHRSPARGPSPHVHLSHLPCWML